GLVRLAGPAAIAEDPVRGLRGARLAARPGWRLDPGTEAAIRAGAPGLATVAAERIRDELTAFLSEVRAAPGLRMLDRLGLLAVLLPESAAMRDTAQPLPHRFDVWEHSLRAVEGIDALLADLDRLAPWGPALRRHVEEPLGGDFTRRESLRLAALLHDVAKPETRAVIDGRIRFFGHDEAGARRIPGIVERWRLPRRVGRCWSAWWPSTCGPCIWPRPGRSRGGHDSASSGRSATTPGTSCCSPWPMPRRSAAPRLSRCGPARAGRWCAR